MLRRLGLLALLLAARPALAEDFTSLAAPTPRAVGQTIALPSGSAATQAGATAHLVNPAGLAFTGGLELDYLHQRSVLNDRVGDGLYLGADFSGVALGFSLEWIRFGPGNGPGFRRTTYNLSLGGEELAVGAAYHIYGSADSLFYDRLSSWDVGIVSRPFRFLSLGFSALDLDAPHVAGIHLPRRFDFAVGVRPAGERLTVSADLLVRESVDGQPGGFDHGALAYNARLRLVDGVDVYGGLTHYYNDGTFAVTAGLELSGPYVGLGYAVGADKGFNGFDHTLGLRISSERHASLKTGARFAELDLNDLLSPTSSPALALLGLEAGTDPYLTVLALLRRAREDTGVQGVVLKYGGIQDSLGSAHVEELRAAVERLRKSGKPVIALLTDADDSDYFLATACDRIYVVPEATLFINGLSSEVQFIGDTLGKIGVRVDVARVGAFKNAPDQLTRADMSPEQREATEAFMKTVYGRYTDAVAQSRKLDANRFAAALAHGILTPEQAKAEGLVDGIAYPDELNELATSALGRPARVFTDYSSWTNAPDRWGSEPRIALIRIQGLISEGKSSPGTFGVGAVAGADTIIRGIEEARDDSSVKAIVVRVDSGGGSGNASNLIYRALLKARERKPVVVSMGNAAASGGYYVAIAGDSIWAEPSTLTGSIGVFVIKPDVSGLFQKLSVGDVTLKQGEHADIFNFAHRWSPEEQKAMQGWVDAFYDRFIGLVAERRKLKKEQVDTIARGRIWSGADAKTRGLVDQLGSLDDALVDAKMRAGLDPDERVELASFGSGRGLLPAGLVEARSQSELMKALHTLGLEGPATETLEALRLAQVPGVVAAVPFRLSVK